MPLRGVVPNFTLKLDYCEKRFLFALNKFTVICKRFVFKAINFLKFNNIKRDNINIFINFKAEAKEIFI